MSLPFFGPAQTDAFIPALAWCLVATVLVVVPVVLAPMLARKRSGRSITVVAVLLAVAALVPGVLQAVRGFAVLGDERATVQRVMGDRYGVDVSEGEAASLLEGGKVRADGYTHTIHLLETTTPGVYAPVESGVGWIAPR